MFGIGPMELMLILVVALLVFGPKRVPELARTLGRGLGEFRRASNDLRQSLALDDLQNDLRRDLQTDLSSSQKIHKPEDPPAQKGDGVDGAAAASADEETGEEEADELPTASSASADSDLGSVPVRESQPSDRQRG
ncbi:MAG: twin-arginine translocase subunit TatB [Deltaproteobacteria bacterium]|nr:twin-arginine translocase subunit TatB [Deltaproteobacteria bacterium]